MSQLLLFALGSAGTAEFDGRLAQLDYGHFQKIVTEYEGREARCGGATVSAWRRR